MEKSFSVIFVAAVLAVFLSSSSMAAWGKGDRKAGSPSFCKGKIAGQLNLTQDQINKALEKEQAVQQDALTRMQENEKMRLAIGQELKKDDPDRAKLNNYIDNISKNRAEIQKKRMEYMLWFKAQLTPEQKQKFSSYFKGMGAEHKQGRGFLR